MRRALAQVVHSHTRAQVVEVDCAAQLELRGKWKFAGTVRLRSCWISVQDVFVGTFSVHCGACGKNRSTSSYTSCAHNMNAQRLGRANRHEAFVMDAGERCPADKRLIQADPR